MKVMFIGGVFAKENENKIIKYAKRPVEFSANIFQKKLIRGFEEAGCDFSVLSAPFIGSYPNASRIRYFQCEEFPQKDYEYVSFNNLWGFRNFDRCKSLKRKLTSFIEDNSEEKLIVVYSPHTPFLEAAVYAKKKDPKIKIHLVVPDLPQYMNLDAHVSMLYKIGKKYDIAKFNRLNREVDSYMLLTEQMKEKIDIHGRPYLVIEGLVTSEEFEAAEVHSQSIEKEDGVKYIVYTGKLNQRFGLHDLADEFTGLRNENYCLVLCGNGDALDYIRSKNDERILCMGQVSPEQAKEWMYKADVLVNPRKNDEEYTRYSFPSKNIEYLMTGNKVVAYKLDGMPEEYRKFMYFVEEDRLGKVIENAISGKGEKESFTGYAKKKLHTQQVVMKLLQL